MAGSRENEIRVANATEEQVGDMARVHLAAFPGEYLTSLGPKVLIPFYRFYIKRGSGIALAAVDNSGRILGFVVGGDPGLRAQFLRKYAYTVAKAITANLFRHRNVWTQSLFHLQRGLRSLPRRIRAGFSGARDESCEFLSPSPTGTWSTLLSICTHPDARGRGVGSALMVGFEQESRGRGYLAMRLSVHNDNEAAIQLYRKNGWIEFHRTESGTYFKRSLVSDSSHQ